MVSYFTEICKQQHILSINIKHFKLMHGFILRLNLEWMFATSREWTPTGKLGFS